MKVAPRPAREAFHRLFIRERDRYNRDPFMGSYLAFRRLILWSFNDCWMIQRDGIWIGIEPDGYTHT